MDSRWPRSTWEEEKVIPEEVNRCNSSLPAFIIFFLYSRGSDEGTGVALGRCKRWAPGVFLPFVRRGNSCGFAPCWICVNIVMQMLLVEKL